MSKSVSSKAPEPSPRPLRLASFPWKSGGCRYPPLSEVEHGPRVSVPSDFPFRHAQCYWPSAGTSETRECAAGALLGMALDEAGITSTVLDPESVGLRVNGSVMNADPIGLDTEAVLKALEHRSVAVLPGFFGRDRSGSVALMGRGGSDLTALFAAFRLHQKD